MGKLLKLKKEQLLMLKEYEDSFNKTLVLSKKQIDMLSETMKLSDKIGKSFKSEFKRAGSDIKTETNILGHPVQGDGSDYTPQSEKENEKTTSSFNEDVKKPTLKEFTSNLLEYLRNRVKGKKDYPKFFKENKIKRSKLNKSLRNHKIVKDSMMGEDMGVKINKGFGNSIKKVYEMFFPGDFELNENSNYPAGAANDSNAPWNKDSGRKTKVKKVKENRYKELFTEHGTSILTDGKYHYYFDFQETDQEEFYDYIEREYTILGRDEDGDLDIEYHDDDIDIDGDVVEAFINDNVTYLNDGKGVSSDIQGIDAMQDGDYDFIIMDEECKREYMSWFKNDSKAIDYLKKIFNIELEVEETTMAGASSGQYTAPFGATPNPIDYGRSPQDELTEETPFGDEDSIVVNGYGNYEMVSGDMNGDDEHILGLSGENDSKEILFKKEGEILKIGFVDGDAIIDVSKVLDELSLSKIVDYGKKIFSSEMVETTTTASSGQYNTPRIWAKSKADHIPSKKPAYPNGKIVENKNLQKDTSYPEGEFVEFDDCVRIGNNNKDAINGGCSQGAVDGVVKTKKSKKSVVSKEALYYEVARKTGKKVEEVRKIIEKKRIK